MTAFFQASYFVSEAIALSGMGLNLFQIVNTIRSNRKQTPFDLSIFSLSIADLLSSNFTLVFMIYWHLLHNSIIENIHSINLISGVCLQYSIISSMLHLVFIATQRVFAVISPFRFRSWFTSKFCHIFLAIIWILSLAFSALNEFVVAPDLIGYFVLYCEAFFVVTYTLICCVVKRQDGKMNKFTSLKRQRTPVFRRSMVYSVLVTFAFIFCTLPATMYYINIIQRVDPSYIYEIVRWNFYLNPTFDSILYFYFKKKLARAHRIGFRFTNQFGCTVYNLESAIKASNLELKKTLSGQKFSYANEEANHKTTGF